MHSALYTSALCLDVAEAMGALMALMTLLTRCVEGEYCFNAEPARTNEKLPMCKEWEGKPSCCSRESLTELLPTLAGLKYHFDRCMSCAENWERVLCTAACSLQ